MRNPKVFVSQIPNRRDHLTGTLTPSINITPAEEHGELVIMMPPQASFHATFDMIRQLRDHLQHYNFEAGDSVVCTGDPSIIFAVGWVLREFNQKARILKWDRNVGRYFPSEFKPEFHVA